ncbi:MAG: orotate phosphoribosyltransferase [Bacteroidales bacterium]|nr:orotate phosphoribosyltransferase [Bacteroidales bacterium]
MRKVEKNIAHLLLQNKSIKLNPAKPFQWTSGWKSPIYCDNRKTLSYPEIRDYIRNEFVNIIKKKFKDVEAIAGVATGAIAHGVLVADRMNLPFLYVRSSSKSHGLEKLIEGDVRKGQRIVVVEDLISTGSSSIRAVDALRNEGCQVLGMLAIFTYGLESSEERFRKADCRLITLSNYEVLLEQAIESGYISSEDLAILKKWRQDPENWMP